ncbi:MULTISPECIES: fumarylacetoacetate hydrolase family protein [Pandoraea]|uniref:FAA hydrolase family protein n=2 Tax=Pandoraea TaxID=93217 RepID=A0AAW7MHC6_9BURK|nr:MULTISPECIES: fumarylacetoacetate hydrolase family protein [Pandoraea]ALS65176.1 5-carboxymethyl-2-hydroxymuconate isomerase [Pandoraea apista]MDN4572066.1 FAA hydrolase family protein [Pandoraea cepalis]MDN4576722.1 FAA hydrolase family protein [Pandoraea cepalis]QHE91540.1 5-carboxymethyl-2-hydroxymuconate isomerase [Pandoraea fibrosis]QHF14902.1 5-carboxymethyl-2-hydroxymuconate isomerase [Pandoraea fibrosis]
MKLVSFELAGKAGYGAVRENGIVDLGRRFGSDAPTLRALLEIDGLAAARRVVEESAADFALADVKLLPVIPNPDKIICVGLNYHDHLAETGRTQTEKPVLFARWPGSQVGHGVDMVRPKISSDFDFEGEMAVIIGKRGRHISRADALSYVAGYSAYNDGSVRDWQKHTSQFLPGKTFAGTGAFGPWLVTTDDIPDPTRLTLETRLNGQVVQHTTTNLMITDIPALIEYCSTILPLEPGDVLVTGTPGGVGAKRTPPLWMKPGDVVEVEISQIGVLRNSIADEV